MSIRVPSVLLRTVAAPVLFLSLLGATPQTAPQSGPQPASATGRGRGHQTPPGGILRNAANPLFWEGRVGPEDAPKGGEPVECAGRPLRSLPSEDRFAVRHLPQPESAGRRAGGAPMVRQSRRAHAAAGRARLLRRVRHASSVDLQGRRAGRRVRRNHRGLTVGIHPRARQRLVRRLDRLRPELQRRAGGRVRSAGRGRIPAAIRPVKRLLPDLTFHGTERISFDTPSFPIFEPDPAPGSSCFDSEMAEDGARTCLRFDQIIANRGAGPVEIGFKVPTGATPDRRHRLPGLAAHLPQQRLVHRSAGGHRQLPRHPRALPLLQLRQRAAVAIEQARSEARSRAGRRRAQGQLLHGRHPHRRVGREGRRPPQVLRSRLPLPAGERRRHRRVPPGHQQRLGGRLRLVHPRSIHRGDGRAERLLPARVLRRSVQRNRRRERRQQLRRQSHPPERDGRPGQESRSAAHHRTGPARRERQDTERRYPCQGRERPRISEAESCGSGPGRRPRPWSRPRPVPLWSQPAPGTSPAPPNRA